MVVRLLVVARRRAVAVEMAVVRAVVVDWR
jgi:hypothetical protein